MSDERITAEFRDKLFWADAGPSYTESERNPNRFCFDLAISWEDAAQHIESLEAKLDYFEKAFNGAMEDLAQADADKATLTDRLGSLLHVLRNAGRIGAESDEPEGSRYIQLSDTLVAQMIDGTLGVPPAATFPKPAVHTR